MENKKRFILATSFLGALTLALGAMVYVVGKTGLDSYQQASALEVQKNTVDFEIRNEKGEYTYTSEYTAYGLELHVTGGGWDGWKFGLTHWNYPVPEAEHNYYCSFTLTVDSFGSESSKKGDPKYEFSEIFLSCNEGKTGYAGKTEEKKFEEGIEFTIGAAFKSVSTGNEISLQLGQIRDGNGTRNYNVKVKEFVLKEDEGTSKGTVLKRISFESGAAFAARWKTAHSTTNIENKYFCPDHAGEDTCKKLIYDYCDLVPSQRDYMNVVAANRWIVDGVAHGEVSRACSERWRGGLFINTNISLSENHSYKVNFTITTQNSHKFNLKLTRGQWGGDLAFRDTPNGETELTFDFTGESCKLWLLAEYGDSVEEITISGMTLQSKATAAAEWEAAQPITLSESNVEVRLDNDHAKDTQDNVYIENSIAYFAGIYNIQLVD